MFGDIGAWLFRGLGGIQPDESHPGFKHIILSPVFVGSLDSFSASHTGPFGTIATAWHRAGNTITYTVTIPANSSATIHFPANKKVTEKGNEIGTRVYKITAGSYQFVLR